MLAYSLSKRFFFTSSRFPVPLLPGQLAQAIADGGEEATGDDAHRDDVTALMVAAQGGHEDVVRLLVERGADVRAEDEEGFTPLLNAVKVRLSSLFSVAFCGRRKRTSGVWMSLYT